MSKGGNLLLNIGPKADGSIPQGDRKILTDLAAWMQVNGQAINGSRVWRRSMEGPVSIQEGQFQDQQELTYTSADYRFTTGHGAIYAIAMQCPADGCFTVESFADSRGESLEAFHGIISDVTVLGFQQTPITWRTDARGLHVTAPQVHSDFPVTLKITVE